MSDKLIMLAKGLCVIVGISFSLMLVALFLSITWMAFFGRAGGVSINRMLSAFTVILLVVCSALWLATDHYRDNAITYKAQRDKKPESWSWQTQPLLTCSSASVMLLRLMPDTQGN